MNELEIYNLLDELFHAAMTNAPDKRTKEIASTLHKEFLEEANFDVVQVRKSPVISTDSTEEEVKPLTERYVDALYRTKFPYGDDEKGN